MNDHELLQHYAESRCEASFTELVKRHVDLVYSAALRQVGGDAHLAHDVTQSVFVDLARKAGALSGRTVLAGWLYTSAHYAAAKVVRTEQRWRAREQEANSMREISDEPAAEPSWEELQPVIDEAMHELNEGERDAVLLRYLEKKQLGQVGAKLGVSEDAARKRVDRALEKLRGLLAKRGVTSTSAALVMILGAKTVAAAPVGLAANIAGAAIASTATGTTLTILKFMAMSKLKVGLVCAVVVAGVATPLVIQNQLQSKLRAEYEQLRQQNTQLTEQMTPLAADNARLSNLIAQATETQPAQQSQSNEMLKLRGEVARLRQESARLKIRAGGGATDPALKDAFEQLATRASQLRQQLEQMPEKKIPELKFLSQKDWLDAVGEVEKPENDADFRQAMSNLRNRAKGSFGGMLQKALRAYADANGDNLPSDISQLQSYFNPPVDDSMLKRYQLIQSGKLSDLGGQMLISEVAPRVDDEYDSHFEFSLNGISSTTSSAAEDALEAGMTAYANANGGVLPRTPEQLTGYLQQPIDPTRTQKFLAQIPANVTTLEQLKAKR